jgi:hypothetical protein
MLPTNLCLRYFCLIQYVPPNDSFHVSLGIDSGLRVTYPPVRTYNHPSAQSGFSFPGRQKDPKQTITTYSQRITVRNSRQTAVPILRVLDHIPVSNHSSIKVNLISPKGLRNLASKKEADTATDEKRAQQESWVNLQRGVNARWAPPEIGGEGAIEWVCTVGAGGDVELQFEWAISAPVGTVWSTQ